MTKKKSLREALSDKILLLDGAMGSLIQEYNLTEEDFRGNIFKDSKIQLKGNNDVLVLTRPDVISDIHRRYLESGCDILTTDTFSSQVISQKEYGLTDYIEQLNREAVKLARAEADRMTVLTPEQPRYVLGCVGPTSKMLSMSEDVNDPASRAITFDQLESAYLQQIRVLFEGGVDALLIETIFDTLNAKAAISAYLKAKEEITDKEYQPEIMLSMTVSDASGRTLSGQTVEAFVTSIEHANPLSIGLNCGLGAAGMLPYLRQMNSIASCYVSCHPNAGLPNQFGGYDDTPEDMVSQMKPFLAEILVNIVGGCCGTTPAHLAAMRKMIDESSALIHKPSQKYPDNLKLTGLDLSNISSSTFVNVGERCNVAGSRKFLRLISEKKYDEALDIARKQVEDGAMCIDINMDDGLLDAKEEMRTFVNLLASEPSISKVPLMIDSSRFDVIEEGLKCSQGKCIVNSISLKMGESEFISHAKTIKRLGASVIVMCFDEEGQATDYERRIKICDRAYKILTEQVGFKPTDIIFDPNILTIATGIAEHNNYALDFICATEWIHNNLKGTRISGGLSNLSFAFRGNNVLRESMHAVFLYHAIQKGMGMAIMNPATAITYDEIEPSLRKAIEDVVLNTYPEASEKLIDMATEMLAKKNAEADKPTSVSSDNSVKAPLEERLIDSLVKGVSNNLEVDLKEALEKYKSPLAIISGPLMEGMNKVGQLFGSGKMFLPQVVKTARTMKKAVEILTPLIENSKADGTEVTESIEGKESTDNTLKGEGKVVIDNTLKAEAKETVSAKVCLSRNKVVLATVKGDVHDIGKNIVGIILACNNFDVIDLGVMVPAEKIVEAAINENVVAVCLSGLITPSLDEMCNVAKAMEAKGLKLPIIVGGATTSPIHTAVKIAPCYSGPVFHAREAASNPVIITKLLDNEQKDLLIADNYKEQERIRTAQSNKQKPTSTKEEDLQHRVVFDWSNYKPCVPDFFGCKINEPVLIKDIIDYIDWTYFFWAWRVKPSSEDAAKLKKDAIEILESIKDDVNYGIRSTIAFYPASGLEDGIKVTLKKSAHQEDCPCCTKTIFIPTPRQKFKSVNNENVSADSSNFVGNNKADNKENKTFCKSLCDYFAPKDYIGVFAITVSQKFIDNLEELKKGSDDYASILYQTLGDRIVEAAAEKMSRDLEEKLGWKGIRPAIGYPVLPEQKTIFTLQDMIDFKAIGIKLTENGAMYPQASVCGLLISNPQAEYFEI